MSGIARWQLVFEVSTFDGDYRVSRLFETESGNQAKEEGREMELRLSSGAVTFALVEVLRSKAKPQQSEVVWAKGEAVS